MLIEISLPPDSMSDLFALEDEIIKALEQAGFGEFDGNEVGPDGAELFLYGPDADALWAAIEPTVRRHALPPGSYAIKRYGPPGSSEARVELG